MSDADQAPRRTEPPVSLQAAIADVAERRRKDPNWNARFDATYCGPFYFRRDENMTEADFAAWHTEWEERRRCLCGGKSLVEAQAVRQEEPQLAPRSAIRSSLPFGQRILELRHALQWTQREAARQLGVSSRSIIRYELGHSSPVQIAPLLALRRLEMTFAKERATR